MYHGRFLEQRKPPMPDNLQLGFHKLWPDTARPVIGMLHAPPLPGAPSHRGDMDAIRYRVLSDAEAWVDGGADGLMLENFGDAPFFPDRVPTIAVAHLTALASEIRRRFDLPLGVNVLRNDGRAALAIAHAVGAQFIRVNVLCGARVTDQGIVQGVAQDLLRDRAALNCNIHILADVDVKHSAPLAVRPLADEVSDLINRGGADAIIISGASTGKAADVEQLKQARAAGQGAPVLVGSGVTSETIAQYAPHADGFIVGTSVKQGGVITNPVQMERVKALVHAAKY
jgi:membrane complex biogenesis BtpA family protein